MVSKFYWKRKRTKSEEGMSKISKSEKGTSKISKLFWRGKRKKP